MANQKICKKCNILQVNDNFRFQRNTCKSCERLYGSNYYKANKEHCKKLRAASNSKEKLKEKKAAYDKVYYSFHKNDKRKYDIKYREKNKDKIHKTVSLYRKNHIIETIYRGARLRALKKNLEFNININDVIITNYCPYLNIPICSAENQVSDNSPTLDRIDNNKGYVKGNVIIVSKKANVMKNNLTVEEIILIKNNYNNINFINNDVDYNIKSLLKHAKDRARIKEIEFDINKNDLLLPKICPLLNIELFNGKEVLCDNSPTLDRIDNDKGYIKDNIRVISYKANRSKYNSTYDEYVTFADNLCKIVNNVFP